MEKSFRQAALAFGVSLLAFPLFWNKIQVEEASCCKLPSIFPTGKFNLQEIPQRYILKGSTLELGTAQFSMKYLRDL